MEREPLSWKGHAFTLFIFTGIVVLCSIFFILGMLAGRAQAQKISSQSPTAAPLAVPNTDTAAAPAEDEPEFTFDSAVANDSPPAVQPPPEPPRETPAKPEAKAKPIAESRPQSKSKPDPAAAPAAKTGTAFNYQVGAVRKSADAERLLKEVRKKGFRAFILAPAPKVPNPFYRVQVGPFVDAADGQAAKKKLESAGYKPILRK
jgi:DedD protein